MLWSAFIIGLAGSVHCLGMCGPLAMALPSSGDKTKDGMKRIFYSVGRIATYSFMGLVFGIVGKGLNLFGFQQMASIVAGVIILVVFALGFWLKKLPLFKKWNNILNGLFQKVWNWKGGIGAFSFGVLNGFLPCGLVYIALAGSIAMASPLQGALFMALFGLGTFPSMFFASMLFPIMKPNWKKRFKKASPVVAIVFAALFIVRGLGLGIPYLSPKMDAEKEKVECCHH